MPNRFAAVVHGNRLVSCGCAERLLVESEGLPARPVAWATADPGHARRRVEHHHVDGAGTMANAALQITEVIPQHGAAELALRRSEQVVDPLAAVVVLDLVPLGGPRHLP